MSTKNVDPLVSCDGRRLSGPVENAALADSSCDRNTSLATLPPPRKFLRRFRPVNINNPKMSIFHDDASYRLGGPTPDSSEPAVHHGSIIDPEQDLYVLAVLGMLDFNIHGESRQLSTNEEKPPSGPN